MSERRRYAEGTKVPAEKSQMEIKTLVKRAGASGYLFAEEGPRSSICFRLGERMYRFEVLSPSGEEQEFQRTPSGRTRAEDAIQSLVRAEYRRRWRATLLFIKAALEMSDGDELALERLMLAHIVLPDGQVVGNWLAPQIKQAYQVGDMPLRLGISKEG